MEGTGDRPQPLGPGGRRRALLALPGRPTPPPDGHPAVRAAGLCRAALGSRSVSLWSDLPGTALSWRTALGRRGRRPAPGLGEVRVEAPEVDDLARGIDLGLKHGLALPEHRRAIDRVAPRRGQQIRGLEEHRGAIGERPAGPLLVRRQRSVHRLSRKLRRRLVVLGKHVTVIVRHHGLLKNAVAAVSYTHLT